MSNIWKNLFENEQKISFSKLALSLLGIVLIRGFLENFSSPTANNFFFSWQTTYLEFPLYYTSVFLTFGILLYLFTKKSFAQIVNFEIRIFLFVLIVPIVDLIVSGGKGIPISYLLIDPKNLFQAFFETMNPFGYQGITPGIHVAAYFILFAMGIFTYRATEKISKAFLIVIFGYVCLFIYAILPTLVSLQTFFKTNASSIANVYQNLISSSWLTSTLENSGVPIFFPNSFLDHSNEVTTQIYFISVSIQLIVFLFIFNVRFAKAFFKNISYLRIFYWILIAAIGMIIAKNISSVDFTNPINILRLIDFIFLLILNILFAICINDEEDIAIDKISNPDRPLANSSVSLNEWKVAETAIAVLIVFGIAIMNHAVAFLLLIAQMSYYIYSAKPLRLKNNFITSSVLIGFSSLAIAMSGFYLVSPDQSLQNFPTKALFIISFAFALISNFKDIKDYEGDRKENILTIPVFFGIKHAKVITSILCFFVLISLPLYLQTTTLLPIAIACSFLLSYLFNQKTYHEKYVFVVLFFYLFALYYFV